MVQKTSMPSQCVVPHRLGENVENTKEEEEIECACCTALQTQNRILKKKMFTLHGQLAKGREKT